MIIEIRYNPKSNGYVLSEPKNKDIAWDDEVAYYDCLNDIFYPSPNHNKDDEYIVCIECRNAWKSYQNEKK